MKARHQRLALILGALVILGVIAGLVLNALNSNIAFYLSPTEVAAGKAPKNKAFRIGGLVKEGSLSREADGVTLRFVITDTEQDIAVFYKGILPDLFKDGRGTVVQGQFAVDGRYIASEVLAKHDENYMPPEAAQAISDAHARAAEKQAADNATPAVAPVKK